MSSPNFQMLVIDDDKLVGQALKLSLPTNWKVTVVSDLKIVPYENFYHAAFVDMHLTGNLDHAEGPEVIKKLVLHNPQIEVVAMSGDLNLQLMETVLLAGAQRFIAKPLVMEEVLLVLEKIEALWTLRQLETSRVQQNIKWIGNSVTSKKIKKQVAELRGEWSPVLIEGETGCGKEVISRLLNQQEGERPFIAVNISSIQENLFESELFGHVKGAFTGAETNKIGLAEAANGGDLFLDEIESMPMSQQVKLLRFLESGEIRKVGAKEVQKIKTRVIVASNRPLKKLIEENLFREDLYFRISSHKILLPPLRERTEDISELCKYFLDSERPRRNKYFSEDCFPILAQYRWPGNVRELKRVCEQLSLIAPLPVIRKEDVQSLISPTQVAGFEQKELDLTKGFATLVEEFEAHVIQLCLKQTPDIEEAARVLQMSRSNLYKKIKDLHIEEKT